MCASKRLTRDETKEVSIAGFELASPLIFSFPSTAPGIKNSSARSTVTYLAMPFAT
jgi:hypothetical protein